MDTCDSVKFEAAVVPAVDAAVPPAVDAAAVPPAVEALPPAVIDPECEKRAAQIAREMGPEAKAGLQDLQNLTISIGLPAARSAFTYMISCSKASKSVKQAALQTLANVSPITETGCMQVDFYNQVTKAPDIAYLLLDKCGIDHKLGEQLEKLQALTLPEKWPVVIKHLSMIIFIGRQVFNQITRMNLPTIRKLFKLADDDPCTEYLDFKVDTSNTTLYIKPEWAERVGIFIKLHSEIL